MIKMKKPIISLTSALKTTGLGLFLLVGFNGCADNDCSTENLKDDCKKTNGSGSGSHSSYFMPMSTYASGTGSSSGRRSGFFSSSGSTSSGG